MTTTQADPRAALPQIDIGDPLYQFLRDRLKFKLYHALILMVIINAFRVIIIPVAHHAALGHSFLGAMNSTDIQLILISFVSQPISLYVYWSLVSFVPEAFVSMVVKGVVKQKGGKTPAQFLTELERKMTASWLSWFALALAIATVMIYQIVGFSSARFRGEFGSYPYNDFQQYVIESIYNLFRFYFLNWAILRILLYVSALRDWWKEFEADVKPLHPDKSGGFSIIGDSTLYGGLLLGAVGLYLAANIVIEVQRGALFDLALLGALVVVTLILAPYAFITPIWSTHKAMERERLRQLQRLSEQYNALWNKISSGEVDPDEDQLAQLESLEKLRGTVLRVIPVWPFAREDLGRFGIALAPIWTVSVTFIIQALLSGFLGSVFTR